MQITFSMENAVDSSLRKRKHQACRPCREKKKRCTHPASPGSTTSELPGAQMSITGDSAHQMAAAADPQTSSSNAEHPYGESNPSGGLSQDPAPEGTSPSEFVGDLNPETAFYSQQISGDHAPQGSRNDVGVWVTRQNEEQPASDAVTRTPTSQSRAITQLSGSQGLLDIPNDVLWGELLPPPEVQSQLVEIYFARVHPLLPLLNKSSFLKSFSEGSVPTALMKAFCLVASKDPTTAPLLTQLGNVPTAADFASRIYADLCTSLKDEKGLDKVTMIRCLALMSLHSQDAKTTELASVNFMEAIFHTQATGIHIGRERGDKQDESLPSLFWALWSLDRLNAAMIGRPVWMHNRDIGLKIEDSIESFDPPFRLWMRLSQQLDSVIELYRPAASSSTGLEKDLPNFEDIVDQCNAWEVPQSHLVSLEIFYHAISIHSRRLTVNKGHESSIPSLRQCNSARQITAITQLKSSKVLAPLPFIPYAVSVALSLTYRELRQSRLGMARELAYKQVGSCIEVLKEYSATWWSASKMVKLAVTALSELEKATEKGREPCPSIQDSQPQLNHEETTQRNPDLVGQAQSSQVPTTQNNQPAGQQNLIPPAAANAVLDASIFLNPNIPDPFVGFIGGNTEVGNFDTYAWDVLGLQSSQLMEIPSILHDTDGSNQDSFYEMAKTTSSSGTNTRNMN
ncbi:hypothetical protein FQN54_003661 [Arachnomyces sp. PD_36]|nr:hypothetical protein FQN54_003661 [Arachnomyces sp. PD_36]